MNDGRQMQRSELVSKLGATVGAAKAQSAIDAAARALSLTGEPLTIDDCVKLLDHLAAAPDIVGIAARLLKVQLALQAPARR